MTDVLEVREFHDRSRSAQGAHGPKLSHRLPGGRVTGVPRRRARPNFAFDDLHCKILTALLAKGPLTHKELAEACGQSEKRCMPRLKQLEDSGIIIGYRPVINLDRLQELHPPSREITIVLARATLRDNRQEDAFIAYLDTLDEVIDFYESDGIDDFLVIFSCVSRRRYNQLRREISAKFAVGLISHQAFPRLHKRSSGYPIVETWP